MNEKCSVLIVDDDQIVLVVLKEMLTHLGYCCEAVMSGRHALELLDGNHYDVMVTDFMMPGMKGLELMERAKTLKPDMRIVVVSGFIDDELRTQAIEAGASDFIEKPISLGHLEKKMGGLRDAAKAKITVKPKITDKPKRVKRTVRDR